MKKANLIFWIFLFSIVTPAYSQLRSTLYPENWVPGMKDAEGRYLHDFSYAGYRRGEVAIPKINTNVVDITKPPYNADNTGNTEVQSILQLALNNVGQAGGGVVYLPEGTYKLNISASAGNYVKMTYSNVVLRGAGTDKTFLYNANSNIRDISLILVQPSSGGDWWTGTNSVTITKDLLYPTDTIPVSSVTGFKVGDWVVIRSDVTADFAAEHEMTGFWGTNIKGATFYRYITAINASAKTLIVDAPTRYYLKRRDNARVYIVNPALKEVGIENFSIGNKETTLAGLGDLDFDVPGTGAYEVDGSKLITVSNAVNCWIKNVNSYKPTQNVGDYHMVSGGFKVTMSRFVTIDSCNLQKPQYEGEGGNGYLFSLNGNDCLVRKCIANHGRHNYDFGSMQCSGNVILKCKGENSRLASDFHMYLSMSNLFDCFTANKDFLESSFRPYGTFPSSAHGQTSTQSVFWNTTGEAYPTGKNYIVLSLQWGWGYVIGTQGAASDVKTAPVTGVISGRNYNTAPEDFREGIGTGNLLQPQSLYEDQLVKRLSRVVPPTGINDSPKLADISVFPNPVRNSILNVSSSFDIQRFRIIDISGKEVCKNSKTQGRNFTIRFPQQGMFILALQSSESVYYKKILVEK